VDIGDRVRAGQLLAEIESPEVDQEYGQAQAALAQARAALGQKRAALAQATANMKLAEATNARWKRLVTKGVLSRQEGDEKETIYAARQADVEAARADIAAAEANIGSHEANVRRLQELRGFQKLTAPFEGVVTARNGDTGDLITAGSGSSVREIYKLAQLGTLRIFINVPQPQVPSVKPGQPARVTVQEYPGRVFAGKVERTSNALDPNSRTLLTEVQVANPDRSLLPGMYAQVEFVAAIAHPGYLVPATVLVVRGDGSHTVATVGPDNKAHYRKLTLGRDFGADTEVLAGLEGEERMIVNPADDLAEGAPVRTR
jgi:RND family efflux transporter MFP subunit